MELLDSEAEVQVGLFWAKVPLLDLEKRPSAAPPPSQGHVRVSLTPRRMPGLELHLRGMRVDEVLPELNKYLDDAYLAGLPCVRVVHGKGTGTLRQVVREALAGHPLVASFREGELKEGGAGVTMVKLEPKART